MFTDPTVFCSYCIVEMKGQFEHSPTTVGAVKIYAQIYLQAPAE